MNDRIYRSRGDRMLAGVAGGMADYWDADPTVVRLVWVLLGIFSGGLALVVYVVLALVVPDEDMVRWPAQPMTPPMAAGPAATTGPGPVPAAGNLDPSGSPMPSGWIPPVDRRAERRMARAAARAQRRAERRARGDSGFALVIGELLVVVGLLILLRQWVPQVYFDAFGPVVLIAIGALLLVRAFSRHDLPTGPTGGWPTGPQDGAA